MPESESCSEGYEVEFNEICHFWRGIGASPFILSVVEEGYKLPFFPLRNTPLLRAIDQRWNMQSFFERALEVLCQSGRVIRCAVPPYVIHPLSVSVQTNCKKRQILDLIHQQAFAEETYKIRGLESGYFIF